MKTLILIAIIIILLSNGNTFAGEPVHPVSIKVIPADTAIAPGSILQFYTEILDVEGCQIESPVEWTVIGDAVGPLSFRGLLVADWQGKILITAATGDVADTAWVTVQDSDPVTLSCSNAVAKE